MLSRLPLAGIVVLQLLAGLALQLAVIATLGAGRQSDLFVAAQAVPTMLFAVLSAPLQNLWQPALATSSATSHEAWSGALRSALGQCSLLFGATTLLAGAGASVWIPALVPGFSPPDQQHTIELTLVLLVTAFINGHNAIYALALRNKMSFILPEATNAITTMFAVGACVWWVPGHGIDAAVYTLLARSVLTGLALMHFCQWQLPNPLSGWKTVTSWRGMGFLVGATSICEAIVLVDRYLGSLAAPGGMTAYSLAKLGMASAASILDRTCSVPFAPRAVRAIAAGQGDAARAQYRRLIQQLFWLTALIGLLLVLVQPFWAAALKQVMGMSAPLASQTWWTCLGLLGFTFVAPAAAAHVTMLFALGDARTAAMFNILGFVVEAGLKFLLFDALGLPGLALATSFSLALNFYLCRRTAVLRLRALQ